MKTIKTTILLLSFILMSTFSINAQNRERSSPPFEIYKVYPYISVTKTQLAKAKSLSDLKTKNNKLDLEYKSEWIQKYYAVEIQACYDGQLIKATSKNDLLTKEQKELLAKADLEKDIQVTIHYLPKNNLVQNEPKTIDFSISLDPENSAYFPEGEERLYEYLDQTVINQISNASFGTYEMTAIKFSVNQEGTIHQTEVFGAEYQSGKFDSINQLLLNAIRKMPNWVPATFKDGTTTDQDFVLTVGSRENCILPLLNVSR